MKNRFTYTLKAWPIIAAATIGLCYLTQTVAKLFGIDLPDQENIELVRNSIGWNWNFAFLCAQILVFLPALEELIFRLLLVMLPSRIAAKRESSLRASRSPCHSSHFTLYILHFAFYILAFLSSLLFSAAHYITQPFPDAAFVALFFFGLAQCWLYRRTDRVWCAMLNHGLFNLTNLVLLFVLPLFQSTPAP